MNKGKLVISLDFELVWGVFDHIKLSDKVTYFDNTRTVLPKMLACFEKYGMEVTWATVGMLFNENWEEWMSNIPEQKPTYTTTKLDAYAYGMNHQKSGLDRFFFAPELIRQIQQTPGQELASHTYSHYYCLEEGQTKEQFEDDLKLVVKMAQQVNAKMQSLVFPRNQWNPSYLSSCLQNGLTQARSNPSVWFWENPNQATLTTKLFRTGDAYLPLSSMVYGAEQVIKSEVTAQPASRFLRPHHGFYVLNALRLQRIKNEMTTAAQQGKVYHLWWHPHNFGDFPEASMQALNEIAALYQVLNEKYGMQSVSMANLPSHL